jgi:hypothetical protein
MRLSLFLLLFEQVLPEGPFNEVAAEVVLLQFGFRLFLPVQPVGV